MASLQWGCRYGMLSPTSRGRKSVLSTYVSCLESFKVLNRLIVVQDRLYSKTTTCCQRQAHRKKRDQFTVLRALASTVDNVPLRPHHLIFDDLVLKAKTHQRASFDAMENGTRAADFILQKYAHRLPLRHPVPAWHDDVMIPQSMVDTVDELSIKSSKDIPEVTKWYNKLHSKGDIPIKTSNKVLEFVSFYATASAKDADEFFNKLENKNRRTYEVYILGLLNCGKTVMAFQIYKQMAEENLYGSLHFYNTLLSHVCDAVDGDKERWNLALDIVGGIVKCNIKPDLMTFNSLMAIALKQAEGSAQMCLQLLCEMKSLNIIPSLGSYYSLIGSEYDFGDRGENEGLKNRTVDRGEKWKILRCYFCGILDELKTGNINLEAKHPLDLLFFDIAMDIAKHMKNYTLATDLLDFVMKNKLEHLTKNKYKFFGGFLRTLMKSQLDIDFVFEQYRRYVPLHFKPDSYNYKELFFFMSTKRNPKYVPALYADYRFLDVPHYDVTFHSLFSAMKHNVPKERREEFLSIAEEAYSKRPMGTKETEEMMTVMIYLMCSCGKHGEVAEKLADCEASRIPRDKIMLSVFELALMEKSLDVAANVLEVMSLHDLELTDGFRQCVREFSRNNRVAVSINERNKTLDYDTSLSLRDAISLHFPNSND